ncbi:MAG: ATP-binding protein, partial [Planctomycetaceae bacterium]
MRWPVCDPWGTGGACGGFWCWVTCWSWVLALLVDREVYSRQDRKRARLLHKAQLKYPDASIEAADFTGISGLDRRALTALALSSWIERGDTVLLSGATGVGKTWAACALAQHAC